MVGGGEAAGEGVGEWSNGEVGVWEGTETEKKLLVHQDRQFSPTTEL